MKNSAPQPKPDVSSPYTCSEYREEMILLALQKKLQNASTPEEKQSILQEISKLEEKMGM